MAQDYYETLEVPRTATQEELKRAFRKKARKHHPDVNPGDKSAEARFKEINAAYEVLSDPEKRKLYDEMGSEAEKIGFDPKRAEEYRAWRSHAERDREPRGQPIDFDLGDIFGDVFGGFRGRGRPEQWPMRGRDLVTEMTISFVESIKGGKRKIQDLDLTIPAGIREGQKIRLAGRGSPGTNGGPPGDLYITVHVSPHPLFRRIGDDLELDLPVTLKEAMFGAEVEIPTIDGTVKLKIPPGSQTLQRLRLKGKGVSRKGASPGSLFARLVVRIPDASRDPETARKAADTLEAHYPGDVRRELFS